MRNSSLALLFGALVFCVGAWNVWNSQEAGLRAAVNEVLERGQEVMDDYHQRLERRMAGALTKLFDELDVNDDGVIQRSEFKGASVGVMAAMRSMDLEPPRLPSVQLPSSPTDVLWWGQMIFTVQIMFLSGIFMLVHMHALVFRTKPSVDLAVDYTHADPPLVSKAEALNYRTPLSKAGFYEKAKMAFFVCSGLFFVRVALVVFFFILGVFGIQMSVIGGRTRHRNPRWFNFWSTFVTFAGSMLMISAGFSRIVSHGALADASQRKILVGNHVCVIEVVYLFLHGAMPSFVSSVTNLAIPFFPAIAKASDSIMLDRAAASSRDATLRAIMQRARDPSADATPLMIFPEGTCNAGSALFQFKRGAFEPGEPIQMVCFKFPARHFQMTWNGRAANGNDLLDLVFRMMCQFVNHMEVVFLPVYHPTAEEKADPKLYAAHAQKMMAAVLREPISNAAYADYVELSKTHRKSR